MAASLTSRQQEIVDYIRACKRPPTIREMCQVFGISSPNGMQSHLRSLQRKGVIEWNARQCRTLRVIEPDRSPTSLAYGGEIELKPLV